MLIKLQIGFIDLKNRFGKKRYEFWDENIDFLN